MAIIQPTPHHGHCHSCLPRHPFKKKPGGPAPAAEVALNDDLEPPARRLAAGPLSYLGGEATSQAQGSQLARVAADETETELWPCPDFGLAWATRPEPWAAEVCKSLHTLKANYAHVTKSVQADAVAVSLTGGNESDVLMLATICSDLGYHALFSFGSHPAWRSPSADHRPHVHGIFLGDSSALFAHWSKLTGESVNLQNVKPFTPPGGVEGWLKYCTHNNVSEYVIGAGMFAPVVANAFGLCAACGRKLDQPSRRDKTYCSAKCRQRDCRGRKRA